MSARTVVFEGMGGIQWALESLNVSDLVVGGRYQASEIATKGKGMDRLVLELEFLWANGTLIVGKITECVDDPSDGRYGRHVMDKNGCSASPNGTGICPSDPSVDPSMTGTVRSPRKNWCSYLGYSTLKSLTLHLHGYPLLHQTFLPSLDMPDASSAESETCDSIPRDDRTNYKGIVRELISVWKSGLVTGKRP
ncbi:uncharacterized protein LACBIDRAFT_333474 [Laccaria bicolor S238N-H82]|uniref:Predicted protein n=1 Tax=Laccaria bicolor (strain S238N-H82 / ATCC MYA-4686) TaxID=486041 RepID=B0DW15_LACBS|nr:uncharacterized protein LACBIDRAFT_333474 [Laccaria bicolor S238N-H82]EDR01266.1 predicted protein [Laccaria bicolor S238N-H82]|eukprot:XP_001888142.1 predicted protein [Laccaria bicolor S238N-H82]